MPLPSHCALFAFCMAVAGDALALQPLVTEDTETQGAGGNQLELGFHRERTDSLGATTRIRTSTAVYTRGLTPSLDAYIDVSHVRIAADPPESDAEGSGNPTVGLKWRFWESEAEGLSAALKPEVRFGASSSKERRGLAAGRDGYGATIVLTQKTGFGAVHTNLHAERVRYELATSREETRWMRYRFSVAPVFELGRAWIAALDTGIETNPDRLRPARMGYIEAGLVWSPRDDIELALGWIRRIADGEPRGQTITAGVTWRFR